jgi:GNAT superfamily N-acetyltransferase
MDASVKISQAMPTADEVNHLYDLVGWNASGLRTVTRTQKALDLSLCTVTAKSGNKLVGFGRIIGDAYTAQILDLMTHPDFRRQGIASGILAELLRYAKGKFLGIYLIDGSSIEGFYERHNFVSANVDTDRLMYFSQGE